MVDKQNLATYIRQTVQLTDDQLAFVLNYFKPSIYPKNKIIVDVGEVNQYMNFIDNGCVRLFFSNEDGQEITRHIVFEHQFATGLASFILQSPSQEALQALESTALLRISRQDFYYLLDLIPAWEKFFRKYLEFAYLNNLSIFQREITKDAPERYKELLAVNPDLVKRLPNKIVASYLNMTPETLSRLKSKI
ncbi:MAG: Crp/Fnr family transcriptional regulator [Pedobacter sp.]|nr:MAG: Crp/Fnr family transcriptional regulator [Pedobacter sp.]